MSAGDLFSLTTNSTTTCWKKEFNQCMLAKHYVADSHYVTADAQTLVVDICWACIYIGKNI
jgi:hypothetical protein